MSNPLDTATPQTAMAVGVSFYRFVCLMSYITWRVFAYFDRKSNK